MFVIKNQQQQNTPRYMTDEKVFPKFRGQADFLNNLMSLTN